MKAPQRTATNLLKQEASAQKKRVEREIFLRKFALNLKKKLGREIEKKELHEYLNQYLAKEAAKRKSKDLG